MLQLVSHSLLSTFSSLVKANQFLSGGIVLGAAGTIIASLRDVPRKALEQVSSRIITTVEVNNKDQSFEWIKIWLAKHPYGEKNKRLMLTTVTSEDAYEGERARTVLSPAPGTHFFTHKGRLIWCDFDRENIKLGGTSLGYNDTIKIRMLGGNRKFIEDLIDEAYELASKPDSGNVRVFSVRWERWRLSLTKRARPLDTLIYGDLIKEELISDIEWFLGSRSWYDNLGIPWRRGYMLYGPPGSGKSSLVHALAGHFRSDLYVLNLSTPNITDETLENLLYDVPTGHIILLEDIDTAYNGRDKRGKEEGGVTFGGLLNVLDGALAHDGRIIFMTTNHRDSLDAALVRSGRVDRNLFVGNAVRKQIIGMFLKFFPGCQEHAEVFANTLPEHQISVAAIQEHLIRYREDISYAVTRSKDLLRVEAAELPEESTKETLTPD